MTDKEIKDILDKKLVNNDLAIADIIMDYLRKKCYMCNERKVNTYNAYGYGYGKFQVCFECCDTYNFTECYKCEVYSNTGYALCGSGLKVCNTCSVLDCWCSPK